MEYAIGRGAARINLGLLLERARELNGQRATLRFWIFKIHLWPALVVRGAGVVDLRWSWTNWFTSRDKRSEVPEYFWMIVWKIPLSSKDNDIFPNKQCFSKDATL